MSIYSNANTTWIAFILDKSQGSTRSWYERFNREFRTRVIVGRFPGLDRHCYLWNEPRFRCADVESYKHMWCIHKRHSVSHKTTTRRSPVWKFWGGILYRKYTVEPNRRTSCWSTQRSAPRPTSGEWESYTTNHKDPPALVWKSQLFISNIRLNISWTVLKLRLAHIPSNWAQLQIIEPKIFHPKPSFSAINPLEAYCGIELLRWSFVLVISLYIACGTRHVV